MVTKTQKTPNLTPVWDLTPAQQNLWYDALRLGTHRVYELSGRFEVHIPFDKGRLSRVFTLLGERFPLLRARVRTPEAPQLELRTQIPVFGLSQPWSRGLEDFFDDPFDPQESLFRFLVQEKDAGSFTLLVRWHHLGADAWSMRVLFQEFAELCRSSSPRSGSEAHLVGNYREYLSYMRSYLRSPRAEADQQYWTQELAGLEPFWNLPTRRETSPDPLPDSQPRVNSVPLGDLSLYRTLGSPFSLVFSVFGIILAQYTGEPRIVTAVPVFGRPDKKFRKTFGHFVNTVVVTCPLPPGRKFSQIVLDVNSKLRAGQVHQLYPFSQMVRDVGAAASPDHAPFTDVYCGQIHLPDFEQESFHMENLDQGGAPWSLALDLMQSPGGWEVHLRGRQSQWSDEDLRILGRRLTTALEQVRENPDVPWESLGSLTPEEREVLTQRRPKNTDAPPSVSGLTPSPLIREYQQRLERIWTEVLGSPPESPDQDFFSLGGHSLQAAQVASRVRAEFQSEIPLGALFRHRTIRDLAQFLLSQPRSLPQPLQDLSLPSVGGQGYPLSSSQKRFWFLHRFAPENAAYHLQAAVRLSGPVDLKGLEQAWKELHHRHEILRTLYREHDGQPVQVLSDSPVPPLVTQDLRSLSPEQALNKAYELIRIQGQTPYDLSRETPLRGLVLVLGPEDIIISLALHHIAGDLWSWGVLARDWEALYKSKLLGTPAGLPDLPLQYKDYAQSQSQEDEFLSQEARAYWGRKLAGLPVLELPADRPCKKDRTGRGAVVRQDLSKALRQSVESYALQHQVTPYMVYLAAFAWVLYRYSGLGDLGIGTALANRNRAEWESLVGTFVNTLVLRFFPPKARHFSDLVTQVKETFLEAYDHRNYPFDRLVEDLCPQRDGGHPPLAQVFFNLHNAPVSSPGLFKQAEPLLLDQVAAQFDLSLTLDPTRTKTLELTYSLDLFDRKTVETFGQVYLQVLENLRLSPLTPLEDWPLLSPQTQVALVNRHRATSRDYDLTRGLAARLWETAALHPRRPALQWGSRVYTYQELFSRAGAMARNLQAQGLGPGKTAGVVLERGPELVISLLGILGTGAAYLPLDPHYPRDRILYALEQSGAQVLIASSSDDRSSFSGFRGHFYSWQEPDPTPEFFEPVPPTPDHPAYILYTSGSTGKPKGVAVPPSALMNFLLSMQETPGMTQDDRLLAVTSVSFDISGLELYLPLLAGGTVVLASREETQDPLKLRRLLETQDITVLQATPATWRMLLEAGWEGRLKTALCGGEAFPLDLVHPLIQRTQSLWNMYGPTETTVWSSLYRVEAPGEVIPIGSPIANTQLYILDSRLSPVPDGMVGDLYIGGQGLALGYWGQRDLTAQAFLPCPWDLSQRIYRTGDRGRFRSDGSVEFLGRQDGQIKHLGHRIELGEIEAALASLPQVKEALCALMTSQGPVGYIAAYLVPRGPDLKIEEISVALAAKLPAYMIPTGYQIMDSLPRTPNGKYDRKALKPPAWTQPRTPAAAPGNDLELQLCVLWSDVLGMDVGVEDDFFNLGGHSLLAVKLLSRMQGELGISLDLRTFFRQPSVRGVVRSLGNQLPPGFWEDHGIFTLFGGGENPPLFIVPGVFADETGLYRYLTNLVKYLGRMHPVYVLRPRGLVSPAPLYTSVEEAARDFIASLKKVQKTGPYRLIGECVGGIFAYETARILQESGERVDSLILMDTDVPLHPGKRAAQALARGVQAGWKELKKAGRRVLKGVVRPRSAPPVLGHMFQSEETREHFSRVEGAYLSLSQKAKINPSPVTVHLLVNEEAHRKNPGLGWYSLARKEGLSLQVHPLKGDHVTRLTTYGEETGRVIRSVLPGASESPQ